jgi:hypothetical protein
MVPATVTKWAVLVTAALLAGVLDLRRPLSMGTGLTLARTLGAVAPQLLVCVALELMWRRRMVSSKEVQQPQQRQQPPQQPQACTTPPPAHEQPAAAPQAAGTPTGHTLASFHQGVQSTCLAVLSAMQASVATAQSSTAVSAGSSRPATAAHWAAQPTGLAGRTSAAPHDIRGQLAAARQPRAGVAASRQPPSALWHPSPGRSPIKTVVLSVKVRDGLPAPSQSTRSSGIIMLQDWRASDTHRLKLRQPVGQRTLHAHCTAAAAVTLVRILSRAVCDMRAAACC